MPENIMEHISEDGAFADTFDPAVYAGDEFKGTKEFENIPNIATLVKNHLNTKKAYSSKLENVIQRPADNASDEDKAGFRKSLLKELGSPDSADDYEFPRVEGLTYNEDAEKAMRGFFFEKDWPAEMVKEVVETYNKMQVEQINSRLEQQKTEFEEASKTLKEDWKGDLLLKNTRRAFDAIMEFADNDLTALLKDAKIHDTADDLNKWNELGLNPAQIRIWFNIADKMKSAPHVPNEEGAGGSGGGGEKPLVGKGGIYDHPTSEQLATK